MDAKEKVQRMEVSFMWFIAGFILGMLAIGYIN